MKPRKTMTTQVDAYLAYRRKLGFELRTDGGQLLKFAAYADGSGHRGPLTTDLALEWARLPKDAAPLYWARRLEVVRCFARYLAVFDSRTEIPPGGILGPAHQRTQPHIYSPEQIQKLLKRATELRPVDGLIPRTYATFIGLIACTGLRTSEALRLTREDVDLERGILTIRRTKFHKSRLVPLHPTATRKLRQYAKFRDGCRVLAQGNTFFLAQRGTALSPSTLRTNFRRLCRRAGVHAGENIRPPRIYDLRHTFACRRLVGWYEEGVDVEHMITALSTYLGHVKVTDTYWYLTGIPELFAVTAKKFESFAQSKSGGRT